MSLAADRDQIAQFINALFVHADEGTYISLRGFDQTLRNVPPLLIEGVKINGSMDAIIARATAAATQCANATSPAVFAPPVATFQGPHKAGTGDLANGLALSVEIDGGDTRAKRRALEHILGPATLAVQSGGEWTDEHGEVFPKLHLHWRLSEPTRTPEDHETLRQARRMAAALVGADPTGAPPAHPFRWSGSWNLKGQPRLATVAGGDPAAEVHLPEALEALQEAVEHAGLATVGIGHASNAKPAQAPLPRLASAMAEVPNPDLHYDQWIRMGYALHRATGGSAEGRALWDDWSRKSQKYNSTEQDAAWARIGNAVNGSAVPRTIGAGTIFWEATQAGWKPPDPEPPPPEDDPGYWASIETTAMSEAQWNELERRESGTAIPASKEAHARAGKDVLWSLVGGWSEVDIPQRPWIARGYLMRGAVTVLSGPGSAGKSSLMVAWAASLTLKMPFHRFSAPDFYRVCTYNVEDDENEQKRRFSAIFRQFGAVPSDTGDRLAILGPHRVGTLLTLNQDGTLMMNTPVMDRLEEFVSEFKPDVIMLDPFVELHAAEENDNTAIRAVMARFRTMAIEHDMAVVLLHHSRKGIASPGDPDSLRGASAIVGAARVALTINVMTEDEAKAFGLPVDARRDYFRVDGAKSNYARIEDAEWFERIEHQLDNGDGVAAASPWSPPRLAPTQDQADGLVDLVAAGSPSGLPWSDRLSESEPRSIRHGLMRLGLDSAARQKAALNAAIAAGQIVVGLFNRPGKAKGDVARGLRASDGRPASVEWQS